MAVAHTRDVGRRCRSPFDRLRVAVLAGAVSALGFSVAPPAFAAVQVGSGSAYVALGDSYAAGEGLGSYESGTDVPTGPKRNMCHRSPYAFSQLPALVLPDVTDRAFWACSGATSADMMNPPPQTGRHEQYGQPRQTDEVGSDTQWMSLSAGGDDLQFGAVGLACAELIVSHTYVRRFSAKSCTAELASARALLTSTQTNLEKLYSKLLARAPDGVLAVVGYPRIFPASYAGVPTLKGAPFCVLDHYPGLVVSDVGLPVSDAQQVDAFVVDINSMIQGAVQQVRQSLGSSAFRIQYVDTYSHSIPHNCKGTTPGATVAAAELALGDGIGGSIPKEFVSSATFHPTKAGQEMFGEQVQDSFDASEPVISTTQLPDATVGQPYQAELTTNDHRDGSWSVVSGALPPGLSLSGYTISGTPTLVGDTTVGMLFTDATGRTASAQVTISVDNAAVEPPPPSTGPTATSFTAPLPTGASSFGSGLGAVACRTDGFCAAIGYYLDGSYTPHGLLETKTSGGWVPASTPLPPDGSATGTSSLWSIACVDNGSCFAVGTYTDANSATQPMIVWSSGVSWTAERLPMPADASPTRTVPTLNSISCLADGCIAVGSYVDASAHQQMLIERLSGGTWTAATGPVPSDAYVDPGIEMTTVACGADTNDCAAVGSYNSASGFRVGLLEAVSSGVWSASPATAPGNANQSVSGPSSVGCESSGVCIAVGSYPLIPPTNASQSVTETWNGATWVANYASSPSDADPNFPGDISAITCQSIDCWAVGGYTRSTGTSGADVFSIAGTAMSGEAGPVPQDAAADPQDSLVTVSCSSSTICGAVGWYRNQQDVPTPMLAVLSSSSWVAVPAPLPADAFAPLASPPLTAVSCWAAGQCVAVGNYPVDSIGTVQAVLSTSG